MHKRSQSAIALRALLGLILLASIVTSVTSCIPVDLYAVPGTSPMTGSGSTIMAEAKEQTELGAANAMEPWATAYAQEEVAPAGRVEPALSNLATATPVEAPSSIPQISVAPAVTSTAETMGAVVAAMRLPVPGAEPEPLAIDVMRAQTYPGSELNIAKTLPPGAKYDRYIASYLSEGLKINGLLTVPQGTTPATGWPVIVFNHGYIPPEAYHTTERYVAYVDAIARSGYIVFKPDFRGHDQSEGKATGGYGSPAYTIDALNAVATLKAFKAADPNRIGMWGHSMGGHITLRSMVVSKDIRAGVVWAGVVASYPDLMYRWTRPHPVPTARYANHWPELLTAKYGTPVDNPKFWASISPISYVADLSGPIQLHHGTADENVPLAFSESLNEAIQVAGGSVEFYTYPGDNHNISANFRTAMQRSIAFFDMYVKGAP